MCVMMEDDRLEDVMMIPFAVSSDHDLVGAGRGGVDPQDVLTRIDFGQPFSLKVGSSDST